MTSPDTPMTSDQAPAIRTNPGFAIRGAMPRPLRDASEEAGGAREASRAEPASSPASNHAREGEPDEAPGRLLEGRADRLGDDGFRRDQVRLAQKVPHHHGNEHLVPGRDGTIAAPAHEEVQRHIDDRIALGKPPGVKAEGLAGDGREALPQAASQDAVQRIAHARRAVVEEVLVPVEAILEKTVALDQVEQREALGRGQIELLLHHAPARGRVERDHRFRREALHPVLPVPQQESPEEALLVEVEHAPVVRDIQSAGRILDANGVVAEHLIDEVARPDRDQ